MGLDSVQIDGLITLVLVFARIYGFMYFFPMISGEQVPAMVRVILCLALLPAIGLPMVFSHELQGARGAEHYVLLLKEAVMGAFLGLVCGLPLRLPEMIGDVIDNQRGTAVTDTFNPTSGGDASLLGQLMSLAVVVFFFSAGGFDLLVTFLIGTFKWIPLTHFVPAWGDDFWRLTLSVFTQYMNIFIMLSLPVMVAMFLAEIALAVASRFAQSLNVFSLAQPIKALIAIGLLLTMMPRVTQEVMAWMNQLIEKLSVP